jgi:hypothetical protein
MIRSTVEFVAAIAIWLLGVFLFSVLSIAALGVVYFTARLIE